MKKLILVAVISSLAMAFTACSTAEGATEKEVEQVATVNDEKQIEQENDGKIVLEERIFVADAAMYRGTIVSVEETPDAKRITLEQATGTNFGQDRVVVCVTDDTRASFDDEKLVEGAYLEVFYGGNLKEEIDAIAMNIYFQTEAVIYNGTVKEIIPSKDKEAEGMILLEPIGDGQETAFRYGESTNFYLNFAELKPGDELNVFHKGMLTRSIPPQGIALEVRPYAE